MANSFNRKTSRSVGTTATQIGGYSVATGTQTTVIGLTVANTITSAIQASVYHYDGTNITYLVKNMTIYPGQSQVVVGGEQKVVLIPGDSVYVVSNTATSVDAIMSILEITS